MSLVFPLLLIALKVDNQDIWQNHPNILQNLPLRGGYKPPFHLKQF